MGLGQRLSQRSVREVVRRQAPRVKQSAPAPTPPFPAAVAAFFRSAFAGHPQQHPPDAGMTLNAVGPGILDCLLTRSLHIVDGIVLADWSV
jgi:hypothetical protein